jgi:hypothetical protein
MALYVIAISEVLSTKGPSYGLCENIFIPIDMKVERIQNEWARVRR